MNRIIKKLIPILVYVISAVIGLFLIIGLFKVYDIMDKNCIKNGGMVITSFDLAPNKCIKTKELIR